MTIFRDSMESEVSEAVLPVHPGMNCKNNMFHCGRVDRVRLNQSPNASAVEVKVKNHTFGLIRTGEGVGMW